MSEGDAKVPSPPLGFSYRPLLLPSEYHLIGSTGPIAGPVMRFVKDQVDDETKAQCDVLRTENARLRAENERLKSLIDTMNRK